MKTALILGALLLSSTSQAATGNFICSRLYGDVKSEPPFSLSLENWLNLNCDKEKAISSVFVPGLGAGACCIQK